MDEDTTHKCPKRGCERRVPLHMLACRSDWYAIPAPIRRAVWDAYRRHGMGSPQHGAAIRAAIDSLNGADDAGA